MTYMQSLLDRIAERTGSILICEDFFNEIRNHLAERLQLEVVLITRQRRPASRYTVFARWRWYIVGHPFLLQRQGYSGFRYQFRTSRLPNKRRKGGLQRLARQIGKRVLQDRGTQPLESGGNRTSRNQIRNKRNMCQESLSLGLA